MATDDNPLQTAFREIFKAAEDRLNATLSNPNVMRVVTSYLDKLRQYLEQKGIDALPESDYDACRDCLAYAAPVFVELDKLMLTGVTWSSVIESMPTPLFDTHTENVTPDFLKPLRAALQTVYTQVTDDINTCHIGHILKSVKTVMHTLTTRQDIQRVVKAFCLEHGNVQDADQFDKMMMGMMAFIVMMGPQ